MKKIGKAVLAVASGFIVAGFAASLVLCDEWFFWWAWVGCGGWS